MGKTTMLMNTDINAELVPRSEDRAFNPARRSASPRMRAIIDQAIDHFVQYEQSHAPLRRARSEAETEKLHLCVEALITDLVHRALTMGITARVHISLDDHDLGGPRRYRQRAVGKITKKVIEYLSQAETGPWINFFRPREGARERSSLSAAPKLLALIDSAGITTNDLGVDQEPPEVIALKRCKKEDALWYGRPKGTLLDFEDTSETRRMREEMEIINAYLGDLDLRMEPGGPTVDLSARRLRRIFTKGSFRFGGRLWGLHAYPFWYGLKGGHNGEVNERQAYLLINEEPVEEVDIKACSLTILYALNDLPLPRSENPYVPPEYAARIPGAKEPPKAAFKPLFQAALCRSHRYPAWAKAEHANYVSCSAKEGLEALERLHAPVAAYLHRDFGHVVQRIESDILVDCLAHHGAELSALPLHDCLIVPASKAEEAERRFKEAFVRRLGQEPIISFN